MYIYTHNFVYPIFSKEKLVTDTNAYILPS